GARIVSGTVVSDHSGGNLPEGLLVIQSERGGQMRGISLSVGTSASQYIVGDSVHVNISDGTLKRVDGSLQIVNLPAQAVERVATERPVTIRTVSAITLNSSPD